jgi:hypothetical protein
MSGQGRALVRCEAARDRTANLQRRCNRAIGKTAHLEASIAPLFRALAEYVHAGAAYAGSLQLHGRLDPPMLMAWTR